MQNKNMNQNGNRGRNMGGPYQTNGNSGMNSNGPYQNGSYQNGSYQNGSYQNGPYQNGPYQNGPYQNGPYQNGPYQNQGNYSYSSNNGYPGGPRMPKKNKRGKRKAIIFALEIIALLVLAVGLFAWSKIQRLNRDPIEEGSIIINKNISSVESEVLTGYTNIALFGVDARDGTLKAGAHSDVIMIASINNATKDVKLVSVYRDTYLNIGTDSYQKCNAAYSYGGAEQAVKMLNMNLDMDITNFVTVGYKGLSEVIDGLGGVYIDVDSEEIKHINNYQIGIAEVLKCDYTPVTETGVQLLNGLQATAYCRIRYTAGNDFKRAARQREVIQAIEDQAKKADYDTLSKVFNSAIDDVYTSLDSKDILDLLANITKYRIVDEGGFPEETMRATGNIGAKGSSVVPLDLESNVVWLHQFLFDDANYTVTDSVKEYSRKIASDTAPYLNK